MQTQSLHRKLLTTLATLAFGCAPALADDHGGTLATATTMTAPNTAGNLGTNDLDWFKLVVTVPGRHWIYSTGNTDTYVTLHNSSGNSMTYNDNSGSNYNFQISMILQVGTYYLKVEDGGSGTLTGNYTLSVRSPANAIPHSTPNQQASLGVLGEMDLYRIHPQKAGRNWIFTTGNTDTYATLYDESGNSVTYNDNSGAGYNFLLSNILQPATYYLLVQNGDSGNLTGDYTLSWRSPCNAMPFDEANRDASLGVLGDLDLYRVRPNANGPFWIYTTGSTDTYATLYDDSGNSVTYNDNSGASYNFLISDRVAAGDYFLLIETGGSGNRTGNYSLHQRDASRATTLLQSGNKNASIGTYGDLDLYVFQSNGGSATFLSTSATDTYATLFNSGGNSVTYNANSGSANNFQMTTTLNPGLYFLLVSGETRDTVTGAYQLQATFNAGALTGLSEAGTVVNSAGSSSLEIVATGSWTIGNLPSWITTSQANGNGSGAITLNYAKNLTGASREAVLSIGGQSYTVTQRPEGDTTGQAVPAQMSIAMGVLITVPTEAGISYRVETSNDMNTWVNTGVILEGDGAPQNLAFERTEARQFYRAVPQ